MSPIPSRHAPIAGEEVLAICSIDHVAEVLRQNVYAGCEDEGANWFRQLLTDVVAIEGHTEMTAESAGDLPERARKRALKETTHVVLIRRRGS